MNYIYNNGLKPPSEDKIIARMEKMPQYDIVTKHLPNDTLHTSNEARIRILILCIIDYQAYKVCLGYGGKKYEYLKSDQINPEMLLTCIKHLFDKNYTKLLNKIF